MQGLIAWLKQIEKSKSDCSTFIPNVHESDYIQISITEEIKMFRTSTIVLILIVLFASNALAGLGSDIYSSRYSRDTGTVVAAVEIKNKGIFNLIISAQFLRKHQDKKIYKSDEYEQLLDRLQVEWRGIALQKVLESKELSLADFAGLKNTIEKEIKNLADQLKKKILPGQEVEVVFSISDFFLLEPNDK